jgi:hypothetical protein
MKLFIMMENLLERKKNPIIFKKLADKKYKQFEI